jgi:hypothetical protein
MSLSSLTESHSDASALVGAAQAGKNSSASGAAQLAKVQAQLEDLQSNAEALNGAEDISRILAAHPDLLADIKKLISIYVEDTVMGMDIPDITGDKDWGRYSLHQLKISKVILPPEGLDLVIDSSIAVTIKGVRAELAEFVWLYAKTRGFPKMKDKGVATAAISGLDISVSFDVVADSSSGIMLSNMLSNVTLAQLEVQVSSSGGAASWLYNKLLKAFSETLSTTVEQEMQSAAETALIDVQVTIQKHAAFSTLARARDALIAIDSHTDCCWLFFSHLSFPS